MVSKRDEEARDKAVKAYIAQRIKEATAEGGETLASVAKKIGKSHVTVINMRDGIKCGREAQRAFADAYFDGSMDRLVDAAMGRTRTAVPLEQYPNAEIAAEVARREGVPEEAIRQVLQDTDHSQSEDWTPQAWVEEMRARARRLRRGGRHVDEVEVVDEAPPGPSKKRGAKR